MGGAIGETSGALACCTRRACPRVEHDVPFAGAVSTPSPCNVTTPLWRAKFALTRIVATCRVATSPTREGAQTMKLFVRPWLLGFATTSAVIAGFIAAPHSVAMSQCKPVAATDNPHISTTPGYDATSAHAWWTRGTCASQYGQVAGTLEMFWTSTNSWHVEDTNQGPRLPGSSNKVNLNENCVDHAKRNWRAQAAVILGDGSTSTSAWRQINNLPCRGS